MKRKRQQLLIVLSLFLSAFFVTQADARQAKITNITVTNSAEELLMFSFLQDGFSHEIEEVIRSGVTTTFSFQIQLHRKLSFWFDKKIASRVVSHTVKYDLLKGIYEFFDSSDNSGPKTTKDFEELKEWMAEIKGLSLGPFSMLTPGEEYYMKIKATMKSIQLFFPLNYLLFFVSFFDFDTPWSASSSFVVDRSPRGERIIVFNKPL